MRPAGAAAWCLLAGLVAFAMIQAIPGVSQVGAPVGLAAYFGWVRNDRVAAGVLLTWAATAAAHSTFSVPSAFAISVPFARTHH